MTQASRKARAVGINHVALEVDNLEAALEFYGRLFEEKFRGRHDRMAFIDLGDQFINLSEGRTQGPDRARHFGLVVDDRAALRGALEGTAAKILPGSGLDFLDPWGNHIQVVEYRSVQFTKADPVLAGMGLAGQQKTQEAIAELREKGMAED
jgi:catechol 2,3-dioxygenase-like lactoylglutathione lyase family enzyme